MKLGYPDTINNKAYQGEKSPFKMVDKSKADLDKDGKVSDYEENRAEAAFGDAPLNYSPVKSREMSAKRRARRGKRVKKIEAKANSIAEQKYLENVAEEDLPTTPKKGKVRKYDRLVKKANRISDKTTKILRDNDQVPSARKKPVDNIGSSGPKIKKKSIGSGPRIKSPIKAVSPARTKLIAANKAAAEKAKKAEDAIRESESSSEPTTRTDRKNTKLGRVIQARKERRAEKNPKVAERQKGRAERKELNKDIKTEKARVTTARQERKTSKTTDRLAKVKKKVDGKVTKIKSPAKFASAAQRKAVWASKNEKKKK